MTSPYRVAGLADDPFDLPDGAPGKTDDGDVWLRWANVGSYAGWYAIGTRRPKADKNSDFWTKVYGLAAAVGNGTFDSVHAIGPGILSLGGLGVTATSGFAQDLLRECLKDHPVRWMECMAPVLTEPLALQAMGFRGHPMERLEEAIRFSKATARLWVESCSHMLRDDRFDDTQVRFLARVGPDALGEPLKERLRFAKVRDTWAWSQEQQAVWAAALVLALADTTMATVVLDVAYWQDGDWQSAYPRASGQAEATLLTLQAAAPVLSARGVPEHFVSRLRKSVV